MLPRYSARRLVQQASKAKPRVVGNICAARYNSSLPPGASGTRLLTTLVTAAVVGGGGGYLLSDFVTKSNSKATQKDYGKPKYGGPKEVAAAKNELRELFPDRVSDDKNTLETYGYSRNSYHPEHLHSMVVRVFTTEDVVKIVGVARKYRIPITAYSGGTSLEGHFSGVS
jgi:D-lactate dehydrogenase (cytochrome)